MMKLKNITVTLAVLFTLNSFAQKYSNPMDIPMVMSANFGELRNNHFHAGIDLKTQAVTGKALRSIEDGYVSRISIAPGGYGLAVYVTHPSTGHTSVYGHLESFAPALAKYVKDKQYEQESFKVDLTTEPTQFPLKKGDLIGYSGNSGGSLGPHLHFEIRDTQTNTLLDPLEFYKDRISDTRPPEIRAIAVYPIQGRGVVNGSVRPLRQPVTFTKKGGYSSLRQKIEAWGFIGVGVKAYDVMNGTANIYGVSNIRLLVDGKEQFSSVIKQFGYDKSRMINSFTDFADWRLNNSFYMKSFIESGNTLPFYPADKSGYIDINEERTYKITYELSDIYNNTTVYSFDIAGKKQAIPTVSGCSLAMVSDGDNRFIRDNFMLTIPKGNLYEDICFTFSQSPSSSYYSDIFTVNNTPVPLDKWGEVKVKLTNDSLTNKQQYGLVQIRGNRVSWIGGTYADGSITGRLREIGFPIAVSADTKAPQIEQVVQTVGASRKKNSRVTTVKPKSEIRLRVTDNLSGVASVRGTVDGKFVLFENDVKSPIYTYKFDPERVEKGKTHTLVFTASDACGNTSEFTTEFEF